MNRNGAFIPLSDAQRRRFDWLNAPYLKKIVAALEKAEKGSARYVGGCVRDSLLGDAPKDFDIATTLSPDAVVATLKHAGLGAAPTGVEHGTVTAIADHHGVEVTTLRADVSTDGRRATVAFTKDWAVDAGRRDFRINAIYLTPDAQLYDPVGGLDDAEDKRVRFIGEPEARIAEDYLRILRFFRFTARFSGAFDAAGLAACAAMKGGIERLSAERVGAETTAILALPRAVFALQAMEACGVLAMIWPAEADIAALERLKNAEPYASAPLGLAVLYGDEGSGVGARLRLSNAEKSIRSRALDAAEDVASRMSDREIRVLIYKRGKDGVSDAAAAAHAFQRIGDDDRQRLLTVAGEWTPPVFPISGRHVVAAGVAPGPEVSVLLAAAERRWIEEDFPDEARAQAIFQEVMARRAAGRR